MRTRALLRAALIAAALALAACNPNQNDAAFGQRVRAYLLANPQVIEEAYAKLEESKQAKSLADSEKAIATNKAALESDPRDFVANPNGKITVVEFFDYRCPYCKAALPALMNLIHADKDVRFVFKEFPVLDNEGTPGVSKRASLAAMAAKTHGKYLEMHNAMMGAPALDDAAIVRDLNANGMDAASALKETPAAQKQWADTFSLATSIGVNGTPSFEVGGKLIPGADMRALAAAIEEQRKVKG